MEVVHIITALGVGGAERMLQRLVLAQRHSSPHVRSTVVSLRSLGPIGEALRGAGVPVVALGMESLRDLPRVSWHLWRMLRRQCPRVVQTWMTHANVLGGIVARLAGVRNVIWGIRSTGVAGAAAHTRWVWRAGGILSRHVPTVIVCAAEASRKSHAAVGYDDTRMRVIPNGFDLQRFQPDFEQGASMRQELRISPTDFVAGHAGRWTLAKDHLNFVQAAASVVKLAPACRFLMIGRDVDHQNASLMDAIQATGHPERFILLGERDDMVRCLSAMDVFCLSSRSEGFPNVVGEAMSCEVPCVVTDVGDAAVLVGDSGWVVPPEQPVALAKALAEAFAEPPPERRLRGVRARARIASEFSLERSAERFSALLHELANQTNIEGTGSCAD